MFSKGLHQNSSSDVALVLGFHACFQAVLPQAKDLLRALAAANVPVVVDVGNIVIQGNGSLVILTHAQAAAQVTHVAQRLDRLALLGAAALDGVGALVWHQLDEVLGAGFDTHLERSTTAMPLTTWMASNWQD
ncbi:MAG: hypothetical protein LUF68_06305 [Clostridiales bacterium]|nr:hypothetical protein [Clostridiales bacterium]